MRENESNRVPLPTKHSVHHGAHRILPGQNGAELDPEMLSTGVRSRRLAHERAMVRKRRRARRIRTTLVLLLILALISVAVWFAWGQLAGSQSAAQAEDYPGPGTGLVEVTVEPGDTGAAIGSKLAEHNVVKTQEAFIGAFNANKAASTILPGTYTLKQEMSASDAVAALLDPANRTDNTVTVNPGQTAAQVALKIEEVTGFSAEDVNAAMKDANAIGLPASAKGNVEGWLKPGSYEVSSSDTPTSLLTQMVQATKDELKDLGVAEADQMNVLIKASILEREFNIEQYLPQGARVIDNRLDKLEAETRGRLQMDSTVLYGVGKTGGIPTQADMENDNPYNTYLHAGLPPTPISQPSQAALKATLNPAQGDWLYFITVNLDTGETLFSNTLQEQEANTEKLKQWCNDNPGKCTAQ